jgi:hypothetical protein
MNTVEIVAKLTAFGLAADDAERVITALRDGGALARISSAHVPPETEPYVALRDSTKLTLAYVHKGFVDIRSDFAPSNAFEVEHYSGIHRVPFPGYEEKGPTKGGRAPEPLANCPVHFVPTNPDGTCDYCEP